MTITSWPFNFPKSEDWPFRAFNPFPWNSKEFTMNSRPHRGIENVDRKYIEVWLRSTPVALRWPTKDWSKDDWRFRVFEDELVEIQIPIRGERGRLVSGDFATSSDYGTTVHVQDSIDDWVLEALGPSWKWHSALNLPSELTSDYQKDIPKKTWQKWKGVVKGPLGTYWWVEDGWLRNYYTFKKDGRLEMRYFPWKGAYESLRQKLIKVESQS